MRQGPPTITPLVNKVQRPSFGSCLPKPQSRAIGTIPVDPSDDAGDGGDISNWGETGKPAHRPKEPHPRRTPAYLMATTPTTCTARKIATAAMEMWITRCASYRTFPQRNNSNLLVISVVDPNPNFGIQNLFLQDPPN